jgi:hypothetical protein
MLNLKETLLPELNLKESVQGSVRLKLTLKESPRSELVIKESIKESVQSELELKESVRSDQKEIVVLTENCSKNFWELDKFSIKKSSFWESISRNLKLELQISSKKTIVIYSDKVEIFAVNLETLDNYYVKSEILFCKFSNGDKISLKFKQVEKAFEFLQFLKSKEHQQENQEEETEQDFPLVISKESLKLSDIQKFQKKLENSKEFLEKIRFLKQEPKWELVLKKILGMERKDTGRITKITRDISKKKIRNSVKSYCYCRKPDDFSLMIECSNQSCKIGWFHAKCIFKDLSGKSINELDKKDWHCLNCRK